MKVKIGKLSKKTIQYYKINFGFFEPFKVLLDGPFLKKCIDKKINSKAKLEKIFGGKCQLYTTSCIVGELNELGDEFRVLLIEAKRLPKHKCGHTNQVEASQCIKDCLGKENDDRLAIATQDDDLIEELKSVPGVPIVHVVQGKLFVEDPSEIEKEKAQEIIRKRQELTKKEKSIIKPVIHKMKKELKEKKFEKLKKQRRAGGVKVKKPSKGPNPLAVKKKERKQKNENIDYGIKGSFK